MSKREEAKNRIKAGSKGGPPGVWSARKAQLLGTYCKKNGCSLNRNSEEAKSMDKWTKEKWQYSSDKSQGKGRFRPESVWDKMSKKEKDSLNSSKYRGRKIGLKVVPIPKKIRSKAQPGK